MILNDLEVGSLAVINDIKVSKENEQGLLRIMTMGVLPGLEIRKLSTVQTCSEYKVEGLSSRVVIAKEVGDYIIVEELIDDY